MREAASRTWPRWLWISAAVAAADLATKAWMTRAFALHESLEVTPFFNLVLVHNTGAAFSFLAGAGGWQRWFFAAVSIAIGAGIVVMLRRQDRGARWVPAALALVLGGALGNLWDRLTLGYVVDFIQLHAAGWSWPAFNVADSAICVGVAMLLWDSVRGSGERATPAAQEKP